MSYEILNLDSLNILLKCSVIFSRSLTDLSKHSGSKYFRIYYLIYIIYKINILQLLIQTPK